MGSAKVQKPIVLLLGPLSVAKILADQFKSLGFETTHFSQFVSELPTLGEPDALARIRALLNRFKEEYPEAPAWWLHTGVSVWGERQEIPVLCEDLGIQTLSPSPKVLALFGNKLNLLLEAEKLSIPTLVLSPEPIQSLREISLLIENFKKKTGDREPYPFVLKSMKGESNLRLLVVYSDTDLKKVLPLWMEQLRHSAGEVLLFAERYVEGARHVIVPFVRFLDGRFKVFPFVDASLQSHFRKVVEMCPAPNLEDGVRSKIEAWAESLAAHTHYVGLGVLEFFVDADRAYLVEGSARLNTEFHLWETVSGTFALEWQMAAFDPRPDHPFPTCHPSPKHGVSLAMRLYAEDSSLGLPQPGRVDECEIGELDDEVEVFISLKSQDDVRPEEYGMLGSVFVYGEDLKSVMDRGRRTLQQIWIAGSLSTNLCFIDQLLSHPWVADGIFHASFVAEEFLPDLFPPVEVLPALTAFVASHPEHSGEIQDKEVRWGVGKKAFSPAEGLELFEWVGKPEFGDVDGLPQIKGYVRFPDRPDLGKLRLNATPLVRDRWQVRIGIWTLVVRRVAKEPSGLPRPRILALVPGRVHSIHYRVGAEVPAHETVVVVESLRMLIPHALPVPVRIKRWKVASEENVRLGQELCEFEKT